MFWQFNSTLCHNKGEWLWFLAKNNDLGYNNYIRNPKEMVIVMSQDTKERVSNVEKTLDDFYPPNQPWLYKAAECAG